MARQGSAGTDRGMSPLLVGRRAELLPAVVSPLPCWALWLRAQRGMCWGLARWVAACASSILRAGCY